MPEKVNPSAKSIIANQSIPPNDKLRNHLVANPIQYLKRSQSTKETTIEEKYDDIMPWYGDIL